MNHIKRNFFCPCARAASGTAALFICGTESRADNAEANDFYIVHSAECTCDNNNVYDTVILGSTHTYTIQMHAGLTLKMLYGCANRSKVLYIPPMEKTQILLLTP